LISIYLSVSEDASGEGLQKSYLVDSLALKVDLHWPNPETGKEQHLTRTDSLDFQKIQTLLIQVDSLLNELEAPWGVPLDTILSCATCEEAQLLFRLQTQKGEILRLQMPEDYPRSKLPEILQKQLSVFEDWLKQVESKEPLLE
jgi:hypothetical protein